jgi:hypothetical protein
MRSAIARLTPELIIGTARITHAALRRDFRARPWADLLVDKVLRRE